jgi:hypothetical protein
VSHESWFDLNLCEKTLDAPIMGVEFDGTRQSGCNFGKIDGSDLEQGDNEIR